jgi:hypothetical protein
MDGALTSVLYVSINDIQNIYVYTRHCNHRPAGPSASYVLGWLHLLVPLNVAYIITLVFKRLFTIREAIE